MVKLECSINKKVIILSENKKKYGIIALIITSCVFMSFVETVIEPTYIVKSVLKIVCFLFLPLLFMKKADIKIFDSSFKLNKKIIKNLVLLGLLVYFLIIGVYFLTKNIFDYLSLVTSLSADQKVDSKNFIGVALYISFGNSFLEEFLFRLISFIKFSKYAKRKTSYIFSSIMFAVYHISMIGASFPLPLLFLALIGLTVGGLIFDYTDEKSGNIYNSWIVHMFADFAIMTIWYMYI